MTEKTVARICSLENCSSPARKAQMCTKHYQRMRRNGSPHTIIVGRSLEDYAEVFWRQVEKKATNECWEWKGKIRDSGYGMAERQVGSLRLRGSHRVAYFLFTGQAPNKWILHSCDNKICCNPAHLREGDVRDNVQDAMDRGRHCHGEKHGCSRLTEGQVMEIRQSSESGTVLARRYDIAQTQINRIRRRESWKHL